MRVRAWFAFALVGAAVLAALPACGGGSSSGAGSGPPLHPTPPPSNLPTHVVVVVQENRTVDNLFHTLPGVDTVSYGMNSKHRRVALEPMPLRSVYDPTHTHQSFTTEYNGGAMNGFDREPIQ